MTRHGALFESGAEVDEPPPRPSRPAWVELAAAILIVGGALSLFGALSTLGSLPAGAEPFVVLAAVLSVGSIMAGLLVRLGRLWLVVVNYVAVLGFLDLLGAGGSALAFMLGASDIFVVVILLLQKPWYDAMSRWRSSRRAAAGRLSP